MYLAANPNFKYVTSTQFDDITCPPRVPSNHNTHRENSLPNAVRQLIESGEIDAAVNLVADAIDKRGGLEKLGPPELRVDIDRARIHIAEATGNWTELFSIGFEQSRMLEKALDTMSTNDPKYNNVLYLQDWFIDSVLVVISDSSIPIDQRLSFFNLAYRYQNRITDKTSNTEFAKKLLYCHASVLFQAGNYEPTIPALVSNFLNLNCPNVPAMQYQEVGRLALGVGAPNLALKCFENGMITLKDDFDPIQASMIAVLAGASAANSGLIRRSNAWNDYALRILNGTEGLDADSETWLVLGELICARYSADKSRAFTAIERANKLFDNSDLLAVNKICMCCQIAEFHLNLGKYDQASNNLNRAKEALETVGDGASAKLRTRHSILSGQLQVRLGKGGGLKQLKNAVANADIKIFGTAPYGWALLQLARALAEKVNTPRHLDYTLKVAHSAITTITAFDRHHPNLIQAHQVASGTAERLGKKLSNFHEKEAADLKVKISENDSIPEYLTTE